MKKLAYLVPVALFLAVVAAPANAGAKLHGCVDSPENPSAVLGLVLGVASIGVIQLRNRFGMRRKFESR